MSHHMGRWRLAEDAGTDRWSSARVDLRETEPGRWTMRRLEGVAPFRSKDPDSSRIWWRDAGVPQNLIFPRPPARRAGARCSRRVGNMATESLPRPTIDAAVLERAARVIRVLGHPLRLRLLEALEDGERHVAELQEAAGGSQAMVSQRLGFLRAHGVVERRREGPRVYYRIIEPKVSRILACIREFDLPNLAAALSALDGGAASAGPRAR